MTTTSTESSIEFPSNRLETLDAIIALRGRTIYAVRNQGLEVLVGPIRLGPVFGAESFTAPGNHFKQFFGGENISTFKRIYALDLNTVGGKLIRGVRLDVFGIGGGLGVFGIGDSGPAGWSALFEHQHEADSWATYLKLLDVGSESEDQQAPFIIQSWGIALDEDKARAVFNFDF